MAIYIDSQAQNPAAELLKLGGAAVILATVTNAEAARSMNETYPLEKVNEAYDQMMSGKARFRVVLTTGN